MKLNTCLSILQKEKIEFAFYCRPKNLEPVFQANQQRFRSASIIKIPILLSWIELEKQGLVDRNAICDLDAESQVEGAGFARLFRGRAIPFHDVLLMMIATSDNLCTNLVIKEIGLERLQAVMREHLHLQKTRCERKLMDYAARERGLDNWIDAEECIRFYSLINSLDPDNYHWVKSLLSANTDDALLKRDITRDSVDFYHKTGSMSGVLHDWGFTDSCELFLLTQNVSNEQRAFKVFGALGRMYLK
jgi:beta-lactamase class A